IAVDVHRHNIADRHDNQFGCADQKSPRNRSDGAENDYHTGHRHGCDQIFPRVQTVVTRFDVSVLIAALTFIWAPLRVKTIIIKFTERLWDDKSGTLRKQSVYQICNSIKLLF